MIDKELLKKDFKDKLSDEVKENGRYTPAGLHNALGSAIMKQAVKIMNESRPSERSASYLSAEFLVGRAVYNNIMCLGIADTAK